MLGIIIYIHYIYIIYIIYSILCCTWNCAGRKPSGVNLEDLILANNPYTDDLISANPTLPDIYVFGLQEICPLTTKTVFVSSDNASQWEDALTTQLNAIAHKYNIQYEKVESKVLVGLLLIIFIQNEKKEIVDLMELNTSSAGVGVFGVYVYILYIYIYILGE